MEYSDDMTDGEFEEWAETAKLDPKIQCVLDLRERMHNINREARDAVAPLAEKSDRLKAILARQMSEQGEDTKSVRGVGTLRLTLDTKYNPLDWESIYKTEDASARRFTQRRLVAANIEEFLDEQNLDAGTEDTFLESCGLQRRQFNTVIVSKARNT